MRTEAPKTMQIVTTVGGMRAKRAMISGSVALVPTMGALHEGHVALIRKARELADHVAVSIFVNPMQFAPHEDFAQYPRPIERDVEHCGREGVDLIFAPTVDEMYPPDELPVGVDVPELTGKLEGEYRPQFFGGVCRVVAKLFNIVTPQTAIFGQKDYQQLLVVTAMARGLSMAVEIVPVGTVREDDGLAMSSRNVYLNAEARKHALGLIKSLREAERMIGEGVVEPEAIERAMGQILVAHHAQVDYAVVRDARTLEQVDIVNVRQRPVVCLIAAKVGGVRLIDNVVVGR